MSKDADSRELIYLLTYERKSVLRFLYTNGIRVPSYWCLPCFDVRARGCISTPLIGTSPPQCDTVAPSVK